MTISEWLSVTSQKINRLDAELILTHFLGVEDRSYLVSHDTDQLDNTSTINAQVERRANGEPLAYILGYREFYGRRFIVTPDALIPRPETEDIITLTKELQPQKILDIGTGSGCIAVTLALELPNTQVSAIDISNEALRIAQKNTAHHHAKISFYHSNLLEEFQPEPGTLIIANLPYVDKNWDWLEHQSLDYEPSLALYAEHDGLELIFRLIDMLPEQCSLILEADPCQHEAIIAYAEKAGLHYEKTRRFILYFTSLNKT